ncbi:unnamed protein product, partial [Prorocentrum cordatum]
AREAGRHGRAPPHHRPGRPPGARCPALSCGVAARDGPLRRLVAGLQPAVRAWLQAGAQQGHRHREDFHAAGRGRPGTGPSLQAHRAAVAGDVPGAAGAGSPPGGARAASAGRGGCPRPGCAGGAQAERDCGEGGEAAHPEGARGRLPEAARLQGRGGHEADDAQVDVPFAHGVRGSGPADGEDAARRGRRHPAEGLDRQDCPGGGGEAGPRRLPRQGARAARRGGGRPPPRPLGAAARGGGGGRGRG